MFLVILIFAGIIIGLIIGLISAFCILKRRKNRQSVGTLQIVRTGDEEPYLFLSLNTRVEEFMHDKHVILNVSGKQIPHK